MKRTKQEKAITLVALIITIIVLLILAVVTIAAITGDGDLISHANNAKTKYMDEAENENTTVQSYLAKMPEENGVGENNEETSAVKLSTITSAVTTNTVAEDDFGNKITIPAGFKIASDSGNDATEGIVIEDVNNGNEGSQFVWVPCGTIYTNSAKTESKTITLSRYTFANDGTPTSQGDATIVSGTGVYQELATSTYGNTTAKDIEAFKTSVATNGGYYIGRYEAGDSSATSARSYAAGDGTLVCKANQEVYNFITQSEAATKCRNMYTSSNFTSDLVNSYAWDTAIVYIQEFSEETNYARANKSTSFAKTGLNSDKYCNICDMSGNVSEWTTEASSYSYPCVLRGWYYDAMHSQDYYYTSARYYDRTSLNSYDYLGFRPLLYV